MNLDEYKLKEALHLSFLSFFFLSKFFFDKLIEHF